MVATRTDGNPWSMNETTSYKKLSRPQEGRMIAGVAQGFANYLNVDPTLVRLAFVLLTFLAGSGIVLYIAGWVLMPERV